MGVRNVLKKYYQKSLIHKVLYWIGLCILSLLLAFIIEVAVYHFNFIKQNRVKTNKFQYLIDHTNTEYLDADPFGYSVISDQALIRYFLKESYYVDKFKINITSKSGDPIYYSVYSYDIYTPEDNIMVPQTDPEDEDTVYINENITTLEIKIVNAQAQKIKINISDFTYEDYFNYYRFLVLTCICFLLLVNLSFTTRIFKFDYAKLVFINLLVLIPLYSYMVPPNYSWDEFDHLTRAIYIADGGFVYDEEKELTFPYDYGNMQLEGYRSYSDFKEFRESLENPKGGYLQDEPRHYDTSAKTYIFVPYLFSALGIKLAQALNLSGFYYLVFARLLNGIVYTIAATLSIHFFPINKKLLLFFILVPFGVFVACTPSPSAVLLSSMLLSFSIISKYKKEKKTVSTPLYLFLLFLFAIITISRITYAFLVFLLLLIPRKQFKNRFVGKFNTIICILLFLIAAGGTYYYSSTVGGFSDFDLHQTRINPNKQLVTILTKPFTYIKRVWFNSINKIFIPNLGIAFVDTVYNGKLNAFYGLINIILLVFLTLSGKKNLGLYDNLKSRLLFISMFILIYVGTVTSMYMTMTDVDSGNILGIQQRYVIPLLMIILPCIEGRNLYIHCNIKVLEIINVLYLWLLNTLILLMMVARYYS